MTNKLYKWDISVPATLNKAKSLEIVPPSQEGKMFRIEKGFIAVVLDAIAATDQVIFQISKKSQNEATTLYTISSEYEVYTAAFDFHLAEAALTGLHDPTLIIKLPDIEGTLLEAGEKYFLTCLALGQAGATASCAVKLLGHMVGSDIDKWHSNSF